MEMIKPYYIEFPKLGASDIGFISVTESTKLVPFKIERIFWTYFTPENIVRGRHAHHKTEQVLIAAAGRIIVNIEMPDGEIMTFPLENPNVGVFVPPHAWHTMQYSHSAVQLVLASTTYNEDDYIRDYSTFKKVWSK